MKKVLSFITAFCVSVTLIYNLSVVDLNAATGTWTSGGCTVTLTDDGTITVSKTEGGDGIMDDTLSALGNRPWDSNRANIKKVVVNDGVKSIGMNAFKSCKYLQSVDFSGCIGLTNINGAAFESCTSLQSVDFSGCTGLKTLDTNAFGFTALETVDFSGCTSLTEIGITAFDHCTALKTVDLSGCTDLTTIRSTAFQYCTALKTVNLSGCTGLTTIAERAFSLCSALETVDFSSCTSLAADGIGTSIFQMCTALNEVLLSCNFTIDDSVKALITDNNSAEIVSAPHTPDGNWQVVIPPTSSQPGEEDCACTVCGSTVAREIPASGGGDTPVDPVTPSTPSAPSQPHGNSKTYTISTLSGENGTASIQGEFAYEGTVINVMVVPEAGYEVEKITVNGRQIEGTSFKMPAENITVVVTFAPITNIELGAGTEE